MEFGPLVGDNVGCVDTRGAGVIVVEFPCSERCVRRHGALNFDHACRAEIGPRKFFFASPNDFYRMASSTSETRRFQGSVARVFAAVCRASVGNNDADRAFGNAEGGGEFVANSERTLRASPNGELLSVGVASPFGERGTRLKRCVSDESDTISGIETMLCGGKGAFDRALFLAMAFVGFCGSL